MKIINKFGFDWYIDDDIPKGELYAFDPSQLMMFNDKLITMRKNDEVVIRIKKVDSVECG